MSNLIRPKFPAGLTVKSAIRYLRDLARWVGPGFHPDTDFHDYINIDTGERSYTCKCANELKAELKAVLSLLEIHRIDPCRIGLTIQRMMIL